MNVNELLDTIEDALEESANVPLSGGKRIVDVEQIRDYLDEVRAALPGALRQEQQLNVEICFMMGLWYRQMQQLGQAADAFVQGLILKPDSSALYYELANTMREMGSAEGAERYYRNCPALRPNYLDGMFCLGPVLAAQEKDKEAAQGFCRALELAVTAQGLLAIAVGLSDSGLADQGNHI